MIRLKTLLEQTETDLQIEGIEILADKIVSSGGSTSPNANVSGLLNCPGAQSSTGTYSINGTKYDLELVKQAIGTDTTIVVFIFDGTKLQKIYSHPQPSDKLSFRFDFAKSLIPDLSDDTQFIVAPFKGGKPIKLNGNLVKAQVEGFMLT